jgi:hypothetical protein
MKGFVSPLMAIQPPATLGVHNRKIQQIAIDTLSRLRRNIEETILIVKSEDQVGGIGCELLEEAPENGVDVFSRLD